MNTLSRERQIQVLHMLVEGNSIRSIERVTGVNRNTVMSLTKRLGAGARTFLDERLRGLKLRHIQADEIWTFVQKKQAMIMPGESDAKIGDQYLWVAFDQDTKLMACYAIGKRTSDVANAFMQDLASRVVTDVPQISTDGWNGYPTAVGNAFGDNVDYGQIIKDYAEPVQPGRYGPPTMVASERRIVFAGPELDPWSISTSHVERNNLTIRTFMRRFTRLALGFSKKLENLAAAVALHVAYYNFVLTHRKLKVTPAMAAGIEKELWTIEDLYDAITK